MVITRDDLNTDCVLRWTAGPHRGLLTAVRKYNGHSVELRIIPGQPYIGSGSDKRTRYTMSLDQVLAHTEVYRPVRVTPTVVHVAAPTVSSNEPMPWHAPPREETPVPQVYITKAQVFAALNERGITAENLQRAIRSWGISATAGKLGINSGHMEHVMGMWNIERPGKGATPTGAHIETETASLFTTLNIRPRTGTGHTNGQVTSRQGPMVQHAALPNYEQPISTTMSANPLRDAVRMMMAEKGKLKAREEQLRADLAKTLREIQGMDNAIEAIRRTNVAGTSGVAMLDPVAGVLISQNGH